MANVRSLNKEKYNISNNRFRELLYYCLQYPEWQDELSAIRNSLKGISYSDVRVMSGAGNPTQIAAMKSEKLARKCAAVEKAATMADEELYGYLMYAVTREGISFNYLKMMKGIPCERDRYYNSRRKFYFYLDKILNDENIYT